MHVDKNQMIVHRCRELGISVEAARAIGRESGYHDDSAVCWAIGLDPYTLQPLRQRNWVFMAAKTSSVSYRRGMPERTLTLILSSGELPDAFTANLTHLLDEAPAQILVMAVEQVALQTGQPIGNIWANILNLADTTGSGRPGSWKIVR